MKYCSSVLAFLVAILPGVAGAQAIADTDQPGSFLVFPKFEIRGATTILRITNTNDVGKAQVKLNYVCPGTSTGICPVLNRLVTLTAHETAQINVGTVSPPCARGFAVAFAVNRTGQRIAFNRLTGSYSISSDLGLQIGEAVSIQATAQGYRPIGSTLFTDFRAVNSGTGENSRLTLLSLNTLAGQQNPVTNVFIDFWNAVETPYSSSLEFTCWTELPLSDISASFNAAALGTAWGSMVLGGTPTCPIPFNCPPFNYYFPAVLGILTEYTPGGAGIKTLYMDNAASPFTYTPR